VIQERLASNTAVTNVFVSHPKIKEMAPMINSIDEAKLLLTEDEKRLEDLTATFIRGLLVAGRFEDPKFYLELAKRLAALIDLELKSQDDASLRKLWMQAWGARAN